MCDPVTLTMSTLAVGGKVMDNKNQGKAWAMQEEARRKGLLQAVRQANTQDAALQLQSSQQYQAAMQELEAVSMDAIKAQGTVQTAMAESNLEGRSMERTKRDVQNAALRSKGLITENYERDYANIYAARVSNRDNLIAAVEGSVAQPKPDALSQTLGVATAGAQGFMVGQDLWGTIQSRPKPVKTNTGATK